MHSFAPVLLATFLAITGPTTLASPLEARDSCSLYYCTDANFKGSCFNNVHACNECVNIGKKYAGKISSIGAGQGVCCTVYADKPDCDGMPYQVGYPGFKDLGSAEGQAATHAMFNDRSKSFACQKC